MIGRLWIIEGEGLHILLAGDEPQIILYSNTEYKEYLKRRTMRLSLFRSPPHQTPKTSFTTGLQPPSAASQAKKKLFS